MDSYLSFDDECGIIIQFIAVSALVFDDSSDLIEYVLRHAQQNSSLITPLQSRRLIQLVKDNPELALTSKNDIIRELAAKVCMDNLSIYNK
jgi:hypothetical protein